MQETSETICEIIRETVCKAVHMVTLAGLFALAAFPAPAGAQAPAKPVPVANFERFLDHHPKIASELSKNPGLMNDKDFIAHNPELERFLDNHPAVNKQIHTAPGTIANHDGHYAWTRGPLPSEETLEANQGYLLRHSGVAHEIQANPSLLDSPQYIAAHPGLREYIDTHPDIRTEMKRHPYSFVGRGHKGKGQEIPEGDAE